MNNDRKSRQCLADGLTNGVHEYSDINNSIIPPSVAEVKPDGGFRDVELSRRHRMYGVDLPAFDLDHVLVEYRGIKPRALIEYKLGSFRWLDFKSTTLQCLRNLADAARIPAFIAFYEPSESWSYTIVPLNRYARRWYRRPATMTEAKFVELLYKLRGRDIPPEVTAVLREVTPCR